MKDLSFSRLSNHNLGFVMLLVITLFSVLKNLTCQSGSMRYGH